MTQQDYDGANLSANDIITDYDDLITSEIKLLLSELYAKKGPA